jgi:mRNA degradation ribonuclease J1/J2
MFIKRKIPVYCGETTETILQALSQVCHGDLEFGSADIDFRGFRTGRKIRVGSLEIEHFHVDHSVPGAYGFVIHTSNGAVVPTGLTITACRSTTFMYLGTLCRCS